MQSTEKGMVLTAAEEAFKLSSTYVYTGMFIVAGLLVSLNTFTIYQLAENVGQDTTDVGSIFAPYGVGLFVGLISVKWKTIRLDILMSSALLLTTAVLIILPFNKSKTMLYPYQFVLGLVLAVVETGSMYQVRKIQGKDAGVWLGLTGSCLSVGFFLLPLVMAITKNNIYAEYFFVAVCTAVSAILLLLKAKRESVSGKELGAIDEDGVKQARQEGGDIELMSVNTAGKAPQDAQKDEIDTAASLEAVCLEEVGEGLVSGAAGGSSTNNPHYWVEILICFCFILFVGMENSIGVFLQQYLDENQALDAGRKNDYQMLFISTASASKLLVPVFQYYFPDPKKIRYCLYVLNLLSFLAALIWVLLSPLGSGTEPAADFSASAAAKEQGAFMMFLAVNGLTTGGTMSLVYDVCNSLTIASRTGVMFLTGGIYIGSSFFTWVYSGIWNGKEGTRRHEVYPVMVLSITLAVLLLFPLLPYLSYLPNYDSRSPKAESVATDEEEKEQEKEQSQLTNTTTLLSSCDDKEEKSL